MKIKTNNMRYLIIFFLIIIVSCKSETASIIPYETDEYDMQSNTDIASEATNDLILVNWNKDSSFVNSGINPYFELHGINIYKKNESKRLNVKTEIRIYKNSEAPVSYKEFDFIKENAIIKGRYPFTMLEGDRLILELTIIKYLK